MIAAAIWSLLIPGIEAAQAQKQIGWFVAAGGFLLGVLLLLFVDYFMRKKMQKFRLRTKEQNLSKSTFMLILAITIHNIPEGMAVGMAFALAGSHPSDANLMSGAIALAVGIGIQNYPEGMAVALPLLKEGISKKRAFLYGTLSAAAFVWCDRCDHCRNGAIGNAIIISICCRYDDLCGSRRTDPGGTFRRERKCGNTWLCCRFSDHDDS